MWGTRVWNRKQQPALQKAELRGEKKTDAASLHPHRVRPDDGEPLVAECSLRGVLIPAGRRKNTWLDILEEAALRPDFRGGHEDRTAIRRISTHLGGLGKRTGCTAALPGNLSSSRTSRVWPVFAGTKQPEQKPGQVVCSTQRVTKQKGSYRQLDTTAGMKKTHHRGRTSLPGPPGTLDPFLSPRLLNSQTFIQASPSKRVQQQAGRGPEGNHQVY